LIWVSQVGVALVSLELLLLLVLGEALVLLVLLLLLEVVVAVLSGTRLAVGTGGACLGVHSGLGKVSLLILVVATSSHSLSSSLVPVVVLESGLDVLEEIVQYGVELGIVQHLCGVLGVVLLLVVVEVDLVTELILLGLSDFLDLVVIDVELLSIEDIIVELVLGKHGLFGALEAHEGIAGLSLISINLDILNFSILAEKLLELLFGSVGREVLNE